MRARLTRACLSTNGSPVRIVSTVNGSAPSGIKDPSIIASRSSTGIRGLAADFGGGTNSFFGGTVDGPPKLLGVVPGVDGGETLDDTGADNGADFVAREVGVIVPPVGGRTLDEGGTFAGMDGSGAFTGAGVGDGSEAGVVFATGARGGALVGESFRSAGGSLGVFI